jgi:RIO-like serine/threonine protein kinase
VGIHEGWFITYMREAIKADRQFHAQVLYEYGFPVPEPFDQGRHCIVMSLVEGFPLYAPDGLTRSFVKIDAKAVLSATVDRFPNCPLMLRQLFFRPSSCN